MSWQRDDAKLERVRALMAERGLDALVVRAPDNVLYLTNLWGMKGYEVCVFPREGEPVLICLEASEEDAAPHGLDVRRSPVRRLRPVGSPSADLARARPREAGGGRARNGRARALARHAGGRPHGWRADDVHVRVVPRLRDAARTRRRSLRRHAPSRRRKRSSGCGSRTRSRPPPWSTAGGSSRRA